MSSEDQPARNHTDAKAPQKSPEERIKALVEVHYDVDSEAFQQAEQLRAERYAKYARGVARNLEHLTETVEMARKTLSIAESQLGRLSGGLATQVLAAYIQQISADLSRLDEIASAYLLDESPSAGKQAQLASLDEHALSLWAAAGWLEAAFSRTFTSNPDDETLGSLLSEFEAEVDCDIDRLRHLVESGTTLDHASFSGAVALLEAARVEFEELEQSVIGLGKVSGLSWAEIAEPLGITRQSAHRRYSESGRIYYEQYNENRRQGPTDSSS